MIYIYIFTSIFALATPANAAQRDYSRLNSSYVGENITSNHSNDTDQGSSTSVRTRTYRLVAGDTLETIAKRYNLTVNGLRKLNKDLFFANGFDNVKAGDSISIPQMPVSDEISRYLDGDMGDVSQLSAIASQAGNFLANGGHTRDLQSMASGYVTGKLNSTLNDWMGRYGRSRIQLNADEKFSLKNSKIEYLLPIYDKNKHLFFAQTALHRTDNRTQTNLGIGYRYFADDYMVGANAFYDYDISRSHSRAGLGGEYWRDYFKLGLNGYFRLSDWRSSSDLEDYLARPANGWDIRAEGYLPSNPKLGLKLNFEQYYGKEVALFGKNKREKDPFAVTVGANYTPFPLLTLNVDHRQGEKGNHGTRLGFQINYNFDEPLSRQLDPDAVDDMRTVAGSRYDFVERNNNIVLEYKKENVIRLYMASAISGFYNETHSLGIKVDSRHPVALVTVSAADFIAAGGKIINNSITNYSVILPPYKYGGNNSYVITAQASDNKGNKSNEGQTVVTVRAPELDINSISFTPAESTINADGTSQQVLTLSIKDKQGLPFDAPLDQIGATVLGNNSAQVSTWKKVSPGVYEIVVTAGIKAETIIIEPSVQGYQAPAAVIHITADSKSADISIALTNPQETTKIANGSNSFDYVASVKDANGNALSGVVVHWSKSPDNDANLSTLNSVTDSAGQAHLRLTSTTKAVSDIIVTASVNEPFNGAADSPAVSFIADPNSARVDLALVKPEITSKIADGINSFDYIATITDKNGNPLSGIELNWSKTPDNDTTLSNASFIRNNFEMAELGMTNLTTISDDNGQAKVRLISTTKAVAHIVVKASVTSPFSGYGEAPPVNFTADASSAKIVVTLADPSVISKVANGTSNFDYIATITDKNGNPLPDVTVNWSKNPDSDASFSAQTSLSDSNGQANVKLISSNQAVANIIVKASVTTPFMGDGSAQPVNFTADPYSATIDIALRDPAIVSKIANGENSFDYVAKIKDKNGNVLSGVTVNWIKTPDNNTSFSNATSVTDANGETSVTLKSTTKAVSNIIVGALVDNPFSGYGEAVAVNFVADTATARINLVLADGDVTSKIANGINNFAYIATVSDANGNIISGATIHWSKSPDNDALLSNTTTITNQDGQAFVTLKSTTKAVADIVVKAQIDAPYNVEQKAPAVSFTADKDSATIKLSLADSSQTSKIADGQSYFDYIATITDGNGNILSGVTVHWSKSPNGDAILSNATSLTDDKGQAFVRLTSTTKAVANIIVTASVTAPFSGNDQAVPVNFVADASTAKIALALINPDVVSKIANGESRFTYKATVVDQNNNPLSGIMIDWSKSPDNDASLSQINTTTDAKGETVVSLVSTTKAVANIVVVAKLSAASNIRAEAPAVSFIADTSTARISIALKDPSITSKIADGQSYFDYIATITDKFGNPLRDVSINWTKTLSDNASLSAISSISDGNGQAVVTLQSTTKAVSNIMVTATVDTPFHDSNTAQPVSFIANAAKATIHVDLIDPNVVSKAANGSNGFDYLATIVDDHGNPLTGVTIEWSKTPDNDSSFSQPNSVTDINGRAMVKLNSSVKAVANIVVRANVNTPFNGYGDAPPVSFTADPTTATIKVALANPSITSQIADGKTSFDYVATIIDANDNPMTGVNVHWSKIPDNDTLLSSTTSITDDNGKAMIKLNGTNKAVANIVVTASVDTPFSGSNDAEPVSFIADTATATITLALDDPSTTSKIANGTSAFDYTATIVDKNGNPLSGITLTWSKTSNNDASLNKDTAVTDENGKANVRLTSSLKAANNIVVSANVAIPFIGSANAQAVNFTADPSTATISLALREASETSKIADGKNSFEYVATIVDKNGNAVPNITINWSKSPDNNAQLLSTTSVTDANGQATVVLQSTVKAVAGIIVTGTVNDSFTGSADGPAVNFIADIQSATITLALDDQNVTQKVANGTSTFQYTATITDKNGNAVPNITVDWSKLPNNDAILLVASSLTDSNGLAHVTLKSTTKAIANIVVSAKVNAPFTASADAPAVSFVADIASATISLALINPDVTNLIADGFTNFNYIATITDKNGNPLSGVEVNWATSVPILTVLSKSKTTTDSNGQTTVALGNIKKAVASVVVSASVTTPFSDIANAPAVNFIADLASAKIQVSLTDPSVISKLANGVDSFNYVANVTDENGNAIQGVDINWTINIANFGILSEQTSISDNMGQASTSLSSTTAGTNIVVTASLASPLGGQSHAPSVNFTFDPSSATINVVLADPSTTTRVANGTDAFEYIATIKDKNNNPLENVTITWIVTPSTGAILSSPTSITDASGVAHVQLTSDIALENISVIGVVAGPFDGTSTAPSVNFVPDITTATLSLALANPNVTSKVANGNSNFDYIATIKDAKGNALKGVSVHWSKTPALNSNLSAPTSLTNDNGQATIKLYSTTKVVFDVEVTASVTTPFSGSAVASKVNFVADLTSATITVALKEPTPTSKLANGVDSFEYVATIKDQYNNPLPNITVNWSKYADTNTTLSASTSVTDANGQATILLTSTKAASNVIVKGAVSTPFNDSDDGEAVSFIANPATATISLALVEPSVTTKLANGTSSFNYIATIKDANNNPLSGVRVNWSQTPNSEAVLSGAISLTNGDGQAVIKLTSTKALNDIIVTASVSSPFNGSSSAPKVNFIADTSTATITLALEDSNITSKVAKDGSEFNYIATIKDANNNPLAGVRVNWSKLPTNNSTLSATSSITDSNGQALVTLRGTNTAVANIVVTATVTTPFSDSADAVAVSFIADVSTATISVALADPNVTSKVANNSSYFDYIATVKDANNNVISGVSVNWSKLPDNDSILSSTTSITSTNGKAMIRLKSTTKAVANIVVTANVNTPFNGSANATSVSFVGDPSTAKITLALADPAITSKAANGSDSFVYTATIKDINGNPIPNVTVDWFKTASDPVFSQDVTQTDANGQTTVTLTSIRNASNLYVGARVLTPFSDYTNIGPVNFVADINTATLVVYLVNSSVTSKVANGVSNFDYVASVKDANGNPIPNVTITWNKSAGNDATLSNTTSSTNSNGDATISLTSLKAASDIVVTGSVNDPFIASGNAIKVNFTADPSTAKLDVALADDTILSKPADGNSKFLYIATITDQNSNPLQGVTINWSQTPNEYTHLSSLTSITDQYGQATVELQSTTTAIDNVTVNGSVTTPFTASSDAQSVSFVADLTTASLSVVLADNSVTSKVANGTSNFDYIATVKDANNNVMRGVTVNWSKLPNNDATLSLISSVTDINGQTRIKLTSTTKAVANIVVTGSVNTPFVGSSSAAPVSFTADASTASISLVLVDDNTITKVADGSQAFEYVATIKDANNNILSGVTVNWSKSTGNNAILSATTSQTDSNGQTRVTLTSLKTASGIFVTAAVDSPFSDTSSVGPVNFIADVSTATITLVLADPTVTAKIANGSSKFDYIATVQDANSNPLQGISVNWSQGSGSDVALSSATSITDSNGVALNSLKSTTKAVTNIIVTANVTAPFIGASQAPQVSFTADLASATIVVELADTSVVSKAANGSTSFDYIATIKDQYNNPLQGVVVNWSRTPTTNSALSGTSSTTDQNGQATIKLISGTKVVNGIVVRGTVNTPFSGFGDATPVNFIADVATARVKTVTLVDTQTRKFANETDNFTYQAIIEDANGNALTNEGVTINWQTSSTNTTLAASTSTTDATGKATIVLTSTTLAAHNIIVSARVNSSQNSVDADKSPSFVTLTFAIYPADLAVIPSVQVDYKVKATPSDGSAVIEFYQNAGWDSSDRTIANIDVNGIVVAGDAVKTVNISAAGTFNGINYNVATTLVIRGRIVVGPRGIQNTGTWPDNDSQEFLIQAPNYEIYAKCGGIVDSVGTNQTTVGGTGGFATTLPTQNIKSIYTVWGTWDGDQVYNHKRVMMMRFNYTNNTSITCGKGSTVAARGTQVFTQTDNVPSGYALVGIIARAGPGGRSSTTPTNLYISQLSYIFADKNAVP